MSTTLEDPMKLLQRLKGSRTAKKGVITKRIKRVEGLVNSGGSRRVIGKLTENLEAVFQELTQVCAEISNLSEEYDELNELETIRMEVEDCATVARDNLEARKDDPDSSESRTSAWVSETTRIMQESDDIHPLDDEQTGEASYIVPTPSP